MVMELIAGRLVAPYVGSSIYTWTSIIGVFLLGITLGNWISGRLADRYPSLKILGIALLLAAIASLSVIWITPLWEKIPRTNLSFPFTITLFSLVTFFPAAFFLSFVSPLAIKLDLNKLERTGRTVGNIYGISAAGSIVGTFATGFWLIPTVGTRQIAWNVFFVLALIGFYLLFKSGRTKVGPALIILAIIPLAFWSLFKKDTCFVESQYYCIRINKIEIGDNSGYALLLDQLEHSHVWAADFDPFGDNYIRLFALLTNYRFKPDDAFKVLAIGGGGYTLPRYLINNFPKATVTVLEIDPKVTEVNYQKLGLTLNERLKIIHADGRVGLQQLKEKFDLVYGDAFSDFLIPFHLTTRELVEEIKDRLNEGGIYAINLVDGPRGGQGQFLASSLITINSVFPQTYLFPFTKQWQNQRRHTSVIAGMMESLDEKRWAATIPLNDPRWAKAAPEAKENLKLHLLTNGSTIKSFITQARGITLTDNFAPVENMIAHLYRLKTPASPNPQQSP